MEKLWYVVNTYSGHENKVKEKLEARTESMGMQDYIFRVIVPETTEVEVKDGVKKEKVKKMFPGYVLVEMIMTDEAWYILANMGMSRVDVESELQVGDTVNIVDGPFSGMTGKVDNIDLENNRLNIIIDLFGQETNVDVEVYQVNKI